MGIWLFFPVFFPLLALCSLKMCHLALHLNQTSNWIQISKLFWQIASDQRHFCLSFFKCTCHLLILCHTFLFLHIFFLLWFLFLRCCKSFFFIFHTIFNIKMDELEMQLQYFSVNIGRKFHSTCLWSSWIWCVEKEITLLEHLEDVRATLGNVKHCINQSTKNLYPKFLLIDEDFTR